MVMLLKYLAMHLPIFNVIEFQRFTQDFVSAV